VKSSSIAMIVALLVFVVLLFVVIGHKSESKEGVKELKVEKIDKEAVTKIDVTVAPPVAKVDAGPAASEAPKHVVLEKDGANWKVSDAAAPTKKFLVDETQVKGVLEAVGEFQTGDLIANKKDKLADYEIDDAKGTRVIVSTAKGEALDLVFGRAAKGGGSTVRKAGSDDVYVAKGRLGQVAKKDVAAWRKKTILDLKADDITKVSSTNADGSNIVVAATTPPAPPPSDKPDAGPPPPAPRPEWKLVEPSTLPAGFHLDPAQLQRGAATVAALRAQDFADDANDATAGFDKPHTVVEATTKDGKKIVIHVGKEDDKKRNFAKVDGDPQLYLVPAYSAKQLERTLDDFRDLSLFDAKPEDVVKATFKSSQGTVVVEKKGDAWKLVEPKKAPDGFEESQIPAQIAGALRLRASKLATDAPKNAVDAKKASPTIEMNLKGGKKQIVRVGEAVPDDPKTESHGDFYVKGGVDDLVYVMPGFTKNRYDKVNDLFKKPPAPPPGMGGPGGISGMENLPPDVRKKLEEAIKKGDLGGHP
jgi:hypothetical protein